MYIQCFQGEPKRDGVLVPEIRGDMGAESIYSTPSQRLVDNPDGQTHGSRPGSERAPRSAAGIRQAAEPSQLHSSLPTPVHLALNFQSPSGVSSGTSTPPWGPSLDMLLVGGAPTLICIPQPTQHLLSSHHPSHEN